MKASEQLLVLAKRIRHGGTIDSGELVDLAAAAAGLEERFSDDEYVVDLVFAVEIDPAGTVLVYLPTFAGADWRGEEVKVGDWNDRGDGTASLRISLPMAKANGTASPEPTLHERMLAAFHKLEAEGLGVPEIRELIDELNGERAAGKGES